MALYKELEKTGNWLFQRRGWLPMFIYPAMMLVIYYNSSTENLYYNNIYWSICCFATSGLGLLVRAITIGHTPKNTSGRNTKEQVADTLNTTGIYATVRHPLYLGNYLMWLGLLLYVGSFSFVIIISLIYWIYYERIMFAEEAFLRKKFDPIYSNWAKDVPAFLPNLSKWNTNNLTFSLKNVLKREYSGLVAMTSSFAFINFWKYYSYFGLMTIDLFWVIVAITGIIIAVTLRTIKKRTNWLNVSGR